MNTRRKLDAELDALIDEITVDFHDEDEQLSAFDNALYDATFPCRGVVVGGEGDVVSVGVASGRRQLIAACERGGRRYEVRSLTSRSREIDSVDSIVRTLDALREHHGLSKADPARAIDNNPASVRRLLTAPVNPELRTVVAIAEALDAEVQIVPRKRTRSKTQKGPKAA